MWFYTVIITAVCIPHTFPISLTLNSTFMRFWEKIHYWLAANGQKKKPTQKYNRNGSLHTSHSCEHHFSVVVFKTDVVSQLAILWSWSHTLMFSNRSQKHGGWSYYAVFIKCNQKRCNNENFDCFTSSFLFVSATVVLTSPLYQWHWQACPYVSCSSNSCRVLAGGSFWWKLWVCSPSPPLHSSLNHTAAKCRTSLKNLPNVCDPK